MLVDCCGHCSLTDNISIPLHHEHIRDADCLQYLLLLTAPLPFLKLNFLTTPTSSLNGYGTCISLIFYNLLLSTQFNIILPLIRGIMIKFGSLLFQLTKS